MLASRSASRQARTPERKPTAVATRRFFSGVIGNLWGQPPTVVPTFFILEGVNPCDALADDQGVHIVRAFVSLY
jgi:hypothetical protein